MQFGNQTFVLNVDAVDIMCIIVPAYNSMLKGGHSERDDERGKHKHPQQQHSTSNTIIYGTVPAKAFTTDDEATMSEETRTRPSFTHP
jgi:hypothetical protein